MLLVLLVNIYAENLRLCTMLRRLELVNNDMDLYYKYLNLLTLDHASKLGKQYNQTFSLTSFEDSGAGGNAVLNTNTAFKMIENCDFVIGAYSSGQVKNVQPIFSLKGLPSCSGSASNQDLENKVEYPHFIRTCPNDSIQGKVLAQFIIQNNWSSVNIMNSKDAFPMGVRTAFLDELSKNKNVKIVTDIQYEAYQKEFSLYLQKIKDEECTITVFLGEASEFQTMISSSTAGQASMFTNDYVWIGADTFSSYSGKANILYSAPAADRNTVEYKATSDSFAKIQSQFSLDDLFYAPFYLTCVNVFLEYIQIAKQNHNVSTFGELGPNWFLDNIGILNPMTVKGPSGSANITYSRDLVSEFNIFQKQGESFNIAFVYNANENKIVTMAGFKYSWAEDGNIKDHIDIDKLAYTILSKYTYFLYFLIFISSFLILAALVFNSISIYKKKTWTVKRALATAIIITGNLSSIFLLLDLNAVFASYLGCMCISAILWNCIVKCLWDADHYEIVETFQDS
eukprot:NODE_370_length_9954_cov_0.501776.p1 type:complete len:512 gc:universal NODE_370_length_9954_cov_0.501776:2835-1300(-)